MSAPLWIFDLDNTLHDARPHIFPQINRAMTEYIRDHVGGGQGDAHGQYLYVECCPNFDSSSHRQIVLQK